MPLALMRLPRRRSIVSSMPSTTGPLGAKTAVSRPNSRRAAARGSQAARLSTRPMVGGEPPLPAEPRDPQKARYGAPARGENGGDQQQLGVPPCSLLPEYRDEG